LNSIATIILAAGESTRLGKPKQLLRWGESTLLQHAVHAAVSAELGPVLVVLGAYGPEVKMALGDAPLRIRFNEYWKLGVHTSLRCGVEGVEEFFPECDSAIIMTCDQPFVTTQTLRTLMTIARTNSNACVASAYGGTLGVPALFHRALFPQLMEVKSGGAKDLILKLGASVASYNFPNGATDVDTMLDYARLIRDAILV